MPEDGIDKAVAATTMASPYWNPGPVEASRCSVCDECLRR
jgi:hypothetical protein